MASATRHRSASISSASRVALRAGLGLTPLVVAGHAIAVRVRHLDVVAEHLVEPDLERADPGALTLARLQARDVVLATVAGVLQLVELAIVARANRVTVRRLGRRPLHEGAS